MQFFFRCTFKPIPSSAATIDETLPRTMIASIVFE